MNDNSTGSDSAKPALGEWVEPQSSRSPLRTSIVVVTAMVMVLYLLNPTFGVDLLPDNFPVIGNLDEVAATTILLGCLSYFGIELPWLKKS